MIANVDGHNALNAMRIPSGVFVAKHTAPVVQHQAHFGRGLMTLTGLAHHRLNHVFDQLNQLIQALRRQRILLVKPRPGETHAAKLGLERFHGVVPKCHRVGPSMQKHQRVRPLPFHQHIDALNLERSHGQP